MYLSRSIRWCGEKCNMAGAIPAHEFHYARLENLPEGAA